uniref:GRF-type domain-containing protein n=1 Tax=Setaria italica TaxID=4555 RepID=K3XPM4_SETIT
MTSFGCEYKRRRWYVRYVGESNGAGPVPPALPVPLCRCGVQAEVKQSRHPKTAGRAFYVCKWTFDPMPAAPCDFFQWIDGPDKYDPRICLFPYHSTELKPYHQFRRWVPPPPNPPRMTEEEKQETTCRRVRDPPMCKCGFTPFFRCSLKTHEQVREFESGKAPWPCVSSPSDRCKCGILATQGVVPSELGYGSFYGNAHGDYWEGRTCDWEDFSGRYDLLLKLGNTSEPWKSRKQQEIKEKIRKEYDTGVEPEGLYARETIIKYWRQNRSKYP